MDHVFIAAQFVPAALAICLEFVGAIAKLGSYSQRKTVIEADEHAACPGISIPPCNVVGVACVRDQEWSNFALNGQ